ncbi:isoprenylcysteine carboxylmethyltransferase family protein [bacterium]|nr:isoprenylcysteine carboxylmethyltransferase family protein [candidate division CSSED10-310 bacterium]
MENMEHPDRMPIGQRRLTRLRPAMIFFLCLGTGYGLDRMMVGGRLVPPGRSHIYIGFGLLLIGFVIGAWVIRIYHRRGTPIDPGEPAVELVQTGPNRISRNPLYCAVLIFFSGFSLLLNSAWMLLMLPVLAFALDRLAVRPEEKAMAERFGSRYEEYRRRVRRWV